VFAIDIRVLALQAFFAQIDIVFQANIGGSYVRVMDAAPHII
jgi:hypothetical protein